MKLWNLVPFLITAVYAQDTSIAAVKQAFNNANIPTDLKITFNPKFLLEVALPQNGTQLPIIVHTGIQLPREETAITPIFSLIDPAHPLSSPSTTGPGPFVIAAVDADAPTPEDPTNAQVRHFLGADFFTRRLPLEDGIESPVLRNRTAAISEWRQPTPGGGNHRYIFLAFNQPRGFDEQVGNFVNASTPIQQWDIAVFMQEVGLGDPIAGTFMMVANPNNP
ncbi:hypothetical protein AN958_07180 [Leucoagaricus sp. SymC.cos]|nr:hypothetical protein AN958_07180 [Leucoagaricus sp. SymC.cos]